MNLFQRLFAQEESSKDKGLKKRPDDWSLTVSDLMDEDKEDKGDR